MARGRAGAGLRAALAVLALLAAPGQAQERLVVPSPVLTVDQEELFRRSAFGRAFEAGLQADLAALAAENRRIEGELSEEEARLTVDRAEMDPEAFRQAAAEFDAKVVEIRRTQDQKERDLQRRPEEARQEFFRAAYPILAEIVRERGAVAILDDRAVILSADAIDITEEAIRRVDAEPDAGGTAEETAPAEAAPAAPPAGQAAPPEGATRP